MAGMRIAILASRCVEVSYALLTQQITVGFVKIAADRAEALHTRKSRVAHANVKALVATNTTDLAAALVIMPTTPGAVTCVHSRVKPAASTSKLLCEGHAQYGLHHLFNHHHHLCI
jgi:hypothetical protein